MWSPATDANGTLNAFTIKAHDGTTTSANAIQVQVSVAAVNDAPTLTTVSTLAGATEDTAFTISYATLAAAANEADVDGDTLSFRVEAVSAGTLTKGGAAVTAGTTLLSTGESLVWTPATDANGTLNAFTIKAHDGTTTLASAIQVQVTVAAVNDAPTLTTVSTLAGATEDTAFTISYATLAAAANEADVDGDTLSFRVEAVSTGTLTKGGVAVTAGTTLLSTGESLVWTPATDANGTLNAFTIKAHDGTTTSASAIQVQVSVTAVNQAPTLTTVSTLAGATEDTAFTISYATLAAAANEADVDGDTLSFRVEAVSTGTLTKGGAAVTAGTTLLSTGESLVWTPATDANGTLNAFTIKAHDGTTTSASAIQVQVSVAAVNDAPSFVKGANQTVLEDAGAQSVTTWATSISAGPTDESGQTLTFQVSNDNNALFAAQPAISSTGTLTYTLAANANGSATVTVSLKDNGGTANGGSDTSAAQTFTITVTAVNDAPTLTAIADPTAILEDAGQQTINLSGIGTGASNEAQTLTVAATSSNTALIPNSTVSYTSANATGTLTYTPVANANGTATITVTLSDDGGTANGGGNSVTRTFTVTVTPVNDAPSFVKGADQTVLEDVAAQTVNGWATSLSAGPADESGQTLTFQVSNDNNALFAAQPAVSANGTLTYTLAANANGSATVTISLKDSGGAANGGSDTSASQTFTITVTPVNDAPSFVKGANQTVLEDAGSQIVSNWATSISAGPNNESGQTVSFLVSNNNVPLFSVLPAIGSNGALTFTPADNAHGIATVSVRVKDNGGTANSGSDTSGSETFTITVTSVNDQPTISAIGNQVIDEDTATAAILFTVGDVETPVDRLEVIGVSANQALVPDRNIRIDGTGANRTVTVTPATNQFGSVTIVLGVTDEENGREYKQFVVTVIPVNDAPKISRVNTLAGAVEDTPFSISHAILLGSSDAVDVEGDTLSFRIEAVRGGVLTKNGSPVTPGVTLLGSGETLVWTSAVDANGALDAFTVRSYDGKLASVDAALVRVSVAAVNDSPTITGLVNRTVNEDTFIILDFTVGDLETAAKDLVVRAQSSNTNLVPDTGLLFAGAGAARRLAVVPVADQNGSATITVTVTDGDGAFTALSFLLTVDPVNDPPILTSVGLLTGATEDNPFTITYAALAAAARASDTDGDTISFRVDEVSSGTLTKNGSDVIQGSSVLGPGESLVWLPPRDANGTLVAFTIRAFDGKAASAAVAQVRVDVGAVNDPPTLADIPAQTMDEDASAVINLTVGDVETALTNLVLSARSSNSTLVPQTALQLLGVSAARRISIAPAPDQNGVATITVTGSDAEGSATSKSFSVTVNPVNDAPGFVKGSDQTVVEDAGPRTVITWATSIRAGPSDEQGQSMIFLVTNDNPGLFLNPPAITPAGALTYTAATNANGVATVTMRLKDDGGTANHGADTSVLETFRITVTPVNDPPALTTVNPLKGATNGLPMLISYAALADASDASDVDGDLIFFRLEAVLDGTLTKSGTNGMSGATLLKPGESWIWTPSRAGNVSAFTVRAYDGNDASATAALVEVVVVNKQQIKLVASDGASGDFLGYPLAISGDTVVAGAYRAAVTGKDATGAAYVFAYDPKKTNWVEQAKLTPDDGKAGDWYGYAVGISGNTIVVGSSQAPVSDQELAGAAYVYLRTATNWVQQAKLTASDAVELSRFGSAVAIDGDTIVVGAREASVERNELTGAAYVYVRRGAAWVEQAKLAARDGRAEDWFGSAVSISGDTIVIGASLADISGIHDAGGAYVFVRSGTNWLEQAKLSADDRAESDRFGASVSIFADRVVAGSFLADLGDATDAGAAYVFERRGSLWAQQAKLTARDNVSGDWFGAAVSIFEDSLVVGANQADLLNKSNAGASYVFDWIGSKWVEQVKWTANDGAVDDRFGTSVAVNAEWAVVGSVLADLPGKTNAGAAYLFTRSPQPPANPAQPTSFPPIEAIAPTEELAATLPIRIDISPVHDKGLLSTAAVRIVSTTLLSDGTCRVLIFGPGGQRVQVQASTDLVRWTTITNAILDQAPCDYLDTTAPKSRARYYRVVPLPTESGN